MRIIFIVEMVIKIKDFDMNCMVSFQVCRIDSFVYLVGFVGLGVVFVGMIGSFVGFVGFWFEGFVGFVEVEGINKSFVEVIGRVVGQLGFVEVDVASMYFDKAVEVGVADMRDFVEVYCCCS